MFKILKYVMRILIYNKVKTDSDEIKTGDYTVD